MASRTERILILAKTYPSPGAKHIETSCVAGINRYLCNTPTGAVEYKHKIVDWEAGALYWNCRHSHGAGWEIPFRAKLEEQLGGRELMFLMGNQHRFQDQWLIISLFYPPKRKPVAALQQSLFWFWLPGCV